MTNKQVELFVLSYNRRDYLADCLQSILNQTFRDFTLTVMDNHSNQDIAGLVNSFHDERIRLIINESNIGAYANWMKAYDLASAEYMMVFHDDDCMSPRMLERQVQLFREYPGLSQVSAGVNLVNDPAKMLSFGQTDRLDYRIYKTPASMVNAFLFGKEVFGCGSVLFKTAVIKKKKPERERFSSVGDLPYTLALAAYGPYIQLRSPVYNVRVHLGQDSGARNWSYIAEMEACKYYLEISDNPDSHRLKSAAAGVLAANYAARRPYPPLGQWLKELKRKGLFYWPVIFQLPYYVLRNLLKRFVAFIAPKLYAENVASRVTRKRMEG